MSTISTSGIAPNSIIRSEHLLRIINALSNKKNIDILISGSLSVTGSINGTYLGLGGNNNYTNIALGNSTLALNTTGFSNTAIGTYALYSNTTGYRNTAIGRDALYSNTTGYRNIAIGESALKNNTTGSSNISIGTYAGNAIPDGSTLTVANNSIFIGENTRALADNQTNQIVIGHQAIGNGSNSVTIGNDSITKTILKGNVGIGITSPSEKLEVDGKVLATGFKIANGEPTQALTANGGVFDLNIKADLVNGKVPTSQLPAYVDDVLEFANLASFPATGENGKIYIALDTNITYRWTGTGYVEISASLALGETSSTAYRGDRGKIAYDHSQTTGNPHNTTKSDIGLGNVDNTSDLNKPISTATQTALNNKLDKGNYTGTAQDLKNDIDGKANTSHTHDISNITNLQTSLNLKEDLSNKAIDFSVVNDILYPSVKAVDDFVKSQRLEVPFENTTLVTINHNLDKLCSVTISLDDGSFALSDYYNIDNNNILVEFSTPQTGKIILI